MKTVGGVEQQKDKNEVIITVQGATTKESDKTFITNQVRNRGEGNVFTTVCHSVQGRGGGCPQPHNHNHNRNLHNHNHHPLSLVQVRDLRYLLPYPLPLLRSGK